MPDDMQPQPTALEEMMVLDAFLTQHPKNQYPGGFSTATVVRNTSSFFAMEAFSTWDEEVELIELTPPEFNELLEFSKQSKKCEAIQIDFSPNGFHFSIDQVADAIATKAAGNRSTVKKNPFTLAFKHFFDVDDDIVEGMGEEAMQRVLTDPIHDSEAEMAFRAVRPILVKAMNAEYVNGVNDYIPGSLSENARYAVSHRCPECRSGPMVYSTAGGAFATAGQFCMNPGCNYDEPPF